MIAFRVGTTFAVSIRVITLHESFSLPPLLEMHWHNKSDKTTNNMYDFFMELTTFEYIGKNNLFYINTQIIEEKGKKQLRKRTVAVCGVACFTVSYTGLTPARE